MANNHAIVNTTNMCCWDVDALNLVGVYASGDLDNGVLVTLNGMNTNSTTGKVKGYEYNVALATVESTSVYVIDTPEVGTTIEQQYIADPRYFYNEAGKAMSLRYLMPKVDCIEVDAKAFDATITFAQANVGKYVKIGNNGKLDADLASSAPTTGAYFRIEGLHNMDAGQDIIPTVVLRCMAN